MINFLKKGKRAKKKEELITKVVIQSQSQGNWNILKSIIF